MPSLRLPWRSIWASGAGAKWCVLWCLIRLPNPACWDRACWAWLIVHGQNSVILAARAGACTCTAVHTAATTPSAAVGVGQPNIRPADQPQPPLSTWSAHARSHHLLSCLQAGLPRVGVEEGLQLMRCVQAGELHEARPGLVGPVGRAAQHRQRGHAGAAARPAPACQAGSPTPVLGPVPAQVRLCCFQPLTPGGHCGGRQPQITCPLLAALQYTGDCTPAQLLCLAGSILVSARQHGPSSWVRAQLLCVSCHRMPPFHSMLPRASLPESFEIPLPAPKVPLVGAGT